jgi:hypothetical protein
LTDGFETCTLSGFESGWNMQMLCCVVVVLVGLCCGGDLALWGDLCGLVMNSTSHQNIS